MRRSCSRVTHDGSQVACTTASCPSLDSSSIQRKRQIVNSVPIMSCACWHWTLATWSLSRHQHEHEHEHVLIVVLSRVTWHGFRSSGGRCMLRMVFGPPRLFLPRDVTQVWKACKDMQQAPNTNKLACRREMMQVGARLSSRVTLVLVLERDLDFGSETN